MRVIVIGTGIVGAAAGYQLARTGAETVLVDAGLEGRATSAGAGIVCPWTTRADDADVYRVLRTGAEHYPELLDHLAADGEGEVGYRRVGALRLHDPADVEAAHATLTARAAASPLAGEVRLLDAEEARRLFPPLGHEGPALHVSGAARVDGRLLREALRRAAERHGARVLPGEARLAVADDVLQGALVDGELVPADAVIVAAGVWSPGLLDPVGVRAPVEPQRGQIVHLGLPEANTSRWPVVLPDAPHYLLAFDDSRIVVGATRETGSGFDRRVTAGGLAQVLDDALGVAPGLADATHLETRVGLRPMSRDGRPLLGVAERLPGLVVANGLGPSGLTMGPFVGATAARLALGEDPGIDLTPYTPER